jgi:hypothetical protein
MSLRYISDIFVHPDCGLGVMRTTTHAVLQLDLDLNIHFQSPKTVRQLIDLLEPFATPKENNPVVDWTFGLGG